MKRPAGIVITHLQSRTRARERIRFAQVLEEAAAFLERHGELPEAARWLRKEARAWRRF